MNLSNNVEKIRNVGEQTQKKLNKLGIYTVEDLITYFPRSYQDRSKVDNICDLVPDKISTFLGLVVKSARSSRFKNKIITKLTVKDNTGNIDIIWFAQPYLEKYFEVGKIYIFTGKVVKKDYSIQIESPEYEKIDDKQNLSNGRIVPIYSSTLNFSQKMWRKLIYNVIEDVRSEIVECLPKWLCKNYNLLPYIDSICNIHFPQNNNLFFEARKRLVFEEFFIIQLALFNIKGTSQRSEKSIKIKEVSELNEYIEKLPFPLTNAQKRVVTEIKEDMISEKSMNRLVQGDVGSGKTVVASIGMFLAVKNGYQAVMMAPTEILAKQHYDTLCENFEVWNMRVTLLIGSLTKKQKQTVIDQIKNGEVDIIVGTHAVIQESVQFKNVGLVITDEQHRFGVKQRLHLSEKAGNPDVLVMTATPIPRTLALILYGDLDVSVIDELPKGRQVIDTYYVNTTYYTRIYDFIKKEINSGRQAYVLCPMVEEDDENQQLKSVIEYTKKLQEEVFNEYNVCYIHGKMKSKEKEEIMENFYKNEIQILVSTTVIEVGINVPNATIMIIENSERFGLAQLHQLRGRVGRGEHKSYCILITDSKSKVCKERMEVMKNTNDGFIISEKDLKLRGQGDFFGTRQHGLPEFKIGNLYEDIEILKQSQRAAKEFLEKDNNFELEENCFVKQRLEKLFVTL